MRPRGLLRLARAVRATGVVAHAPPAGCRPLSAPASVPPANAPSPDPHSATATGEPTRFPVSTSSQLDGWVVVETIGVVTASDVRSRSLPLDLWTALSMTVGGESRYYTHLLNEASSAAADRVVERAKELGADGVVNMRFEMSTTMNRLILGLHGCVLCYGTVGVCHATSISGRVSPHVVVQAVKAKRAAKHRT
jgi:uncharacterized protein YbjQ (UPF0145 family)